MYVYININKISCSFSRCPLSDTTVRDKHESIRMCVCVDLVFVVPIKWSQFERQSMATSATVSIVVDMLQFQIVDIIDSDEKCCYIVCIFQPVFFFFEYINI